jgi:hypothetical protein
LDNCDTIIQHIEQSDKTVKVYIQQQFDYLLKNKPVIYALNGILRDNENEARILAIFEKLAH